MHYPPPVFCDNKTKEASTEEASRPDTISILIIEAVLPSPVANNTDGDVIWSIRRLVIVFFFFFGKFHHE